MMAGMNTPCLDFTAAAHLTAAAPVAVTAKARPN
jgi:hypothetical protein